MQLSKEAYPDLSKNDWVDAFVIADHLRFGRINREASMDNYRYKALQILTGARFDVISAGIMAEIGDIRRIHSQASVAKYAGLVWNRNQFGDFEAEHSG